MRAPKQQSESRVMSMIIDEAVPVGSQVRGPQMRPRMYLQRQRESIIKLVLLYN